MFKFAKNPTILLFLIGYFESLLQIFWIPWKQTIKKILRQGDSKIEFVEDFWNFFENFAILAPFFLGGGGGGWCCHCIL